MIGSIGPGALDRRTFLSVLSAMAVAALAPARAAPGPVRLVLVHGRGQQGLDPVKLKAEWLGALREGAKAIGMKLSDDVDVAFPYYGDVLEKFTTAAEIPLVSDVHAKGNADTDEFLAFQAQVAEELRQRAGVTDDQVDAEYGTNPKAKGPLNWEWVQAILRALDKHGGGMGQSALEQFTRDVFVYTTKAGVRDEVDGIVASMLTESPTVVVGHSLGSVVAYSVLRADARKLRIPLFLTVGSPLGIRAVRDQFRPLRYPRNVDGWYNAFDRRDVVALYPLDKDNFPVTPAIENYSLVDNHTDNRHGIVGYLDDPKVAGRLLTGLS
jgi:hypothetical protein